MTNKEGYMVKAIVAVDKNGCIGREGKIPWHNSMDLKLFKSLTVGHTVIMGRKTFESIGKPLPDRDNVVISRQDISIPNVHVTTGEALKETINMFYNPVIIGGSQIYKEMMPFIDLLYISRMDIEVDDGDAFFTFPYYNFEKVCSIPFGGEPSFTWETYIRRR